MYLLPCVPQESSQNSSDIMPALMELSDDEEADAVGRPQRVCKLQVTTGGNHGRSFGFLLLKRLGGGQPPSFPWHARPQSHEIQHFLLKFLLIFHQSGFLQRIL